MTWEKGCKKLNVQKSIKMHFFSMGFRASLKINKEKEEYANAKVDFFSF